MPEGSAILNSDNMNVTMPFDELCRLISDYSQAGYMEAVKAYEPASDNIRSTEMSAWLRIMQIDRRKFRALVKSGAICPFRLGTGRNSPLYYSKAEVKSAINAAGIASVVMTGKQKT